MIIRLADDGKVYRDDKHIATVEGGEIKFNHYSYKKHKDEIEYLVFGEYETTPDPVDVEPETKDPRPRTPIELTNTPSGKWYGEEDPHVVNWRQEHWSPEEFEKRYSHKTELLYNNFAEQGMKYNPTR